MTQTVQTDLDQAKIEATLQASASYIASLEALATEAEELSDDDAGQHLVTALNFKASFAKFSTFWFANAATQELVRTTWPNLPTFDPEDFEMLIKHHLALVDGDFYNLTSRSHDHGIDLWHIEALDASYVASETTVVQCKLYRGYVPVSEVRDFFGVMAARVAHGLFVTTGNLTAQARTFVPIANRSPHANQLHVLSGKDLLIALQAADTYASAIINTVSINEKTQEQMRRQAQKLTWLTLDSPTQPSLL